MNTPLATCTTDKINLSLYPSRSLPLQDNVYLWRVWKKLHTFL